MKNNLSLSCLYNALMDASQDTNFLNDIRRFNEEVQEEYDTIHTAGDKEAIRGVIEKKIAVSLLSLVDSVSSIAKYSESDMARLGAAKFLFGFYFDDKTKGEDSFQKLLDELTKEAEKDNA